MAELATCLLFANANAGKAEDALRFYMSLFDGSAITSLDRYESDQPGGKAGMIKTATFTLGGRAYRAMDSAMPHAFGFTPAMSIFVTCRDRAEHDRLFAALSEGGRVLMPPADYGFSAWFAWTDDRFGVSWQLNVPA